jgi:hypothetical protein
VIDTDLQPGNQATWNRHNKDRTLNLRIGPKPVYGWLVKEATPFATLLHKSQLRPVRKIAQPQQCGWRESIHDMKMKYLLLDLNERDAGVRL